MSEKAGGSKLNKLINRLMGRNEPQPTEPEIKKFVHRLNRRLNEEHPVQDDKGTAPQLEKPAGTQYAHPLNRRRSRNETDQTEPIHSVLSSEPTVDQPDQDESELTSEFIRTIENRQPGTLVGPSRFGENDGGKVGSMGSTVGASDEKSQNARQAANAEQNMKTQSNMGRRYYKGKRMGD